ncbi:MAG: NAD(P)/FAD-dependent oxidoreductase, partial [Alphaproteobacteria bacterium]
ERPGRKILVSGGGRCNVTHDVVDETSFCGSSPAAIRKVLRRFDVEDTIELFRGLGVELVREEGGKLFPASGRARDVLEALLSGARQAGATLLHPFRVESIEAEGDGFELRGPQGRLRAARVVLATGGRSLPRTGSDGHGLAIARALGHSVAEPVVPALVPLVLAPGHFLRELSGISAEVRVEVRGPSGRRLASAAGSLLCTHFGLSGPAVLDASRHLAVARARGEEASLAIDWLPGRTPEQWDEAILARPAIGPGRFLREAGLAERLAEALCRHVGLDPSRPMHELPRERRRALVAAATALVVPVTGDRGFDHSEVTAGGVPLAEVHLETMESRRCRGLHLVGEICDVDGRIGGYNFQWAWASGFVAGRAIGRAG